MGDCHGGIQRMSCPESLYQYKNSNNELSPCLKNLGDKLNEFRKGEIKFGERKKNREMKVSLKP